jgi:polygalacturonase
MLQSLLAVPALTPLAKFAAAQAPSKSSNHHGKPTEPTPSAPKVTLNIRDFGAAGDGATKDTAAIQQTIDRCAVLGGGEVLVPAGNYLTGAIALGSKTLLRLDKDATIIGTPDFADYPVTQVRWEGKWFQGHTALIYALDADNIGVAGPGKVTGFAGSLINTNNVTGSGLNGAASIDPPKLPDPVPAPSQPYQLH